MNHLRLKSEPASGVGSCQTSFDDGDGGPGRCSPSTAALKTYDRRLAQRPAFSGRKGAFSKANALMLVCLIAITRGVNFVNADLYLNEAAYFELVVEPRSVDLVSKIQITALQGKRSEGWDDDNPIEQFLKGDCFIMRFAPVTLYNDERKVDVNYAPFPDPDEPIVCDLKPKAECSRTDKDAIEFKLLEDTGPNEDDPNERELLNIITGTIGPLKNPWSKVPLQMSMIQYFKGCDKADQKDKTVVEQEPIDFDPGLFDLSAASLVASKEEVGASGPGNTVTLKFKPKTLLPDGGAIQLITPAVYSDLKIPLYPTDDAQFVCNSDSLAGVSTTKNGKELTIHYKSITKQDDGQPRDPLAEVVVDCKYWWNPLSPELVKGFRLTTFDNTAPSGKIIDQSDAEGDSLTSVYETIELDASNYRPYPMILKGLMAFTVPSPHFKEPNANLVQGKAPYSIEALEKLPFSLSGCYVKYTFPKELQVSAATTTKFYGAGMLAPDKWTEKLKPGQNEITSGSGPDDNLMKVDFDAKEKYIIVKGCRPKEYVTKIKDNNRRLKRLKRAEVSNFSIMIMDVGNPLALMETSNFGIEVWKDYDKDTNTLSKQIAYAKDLKVPAQLFVSGVLSKFSMTATNKIVQEGESHTLTFTSQNDMPSQKESDTQYEIRPAIHIAFPQTIKTKEQLTTVDGEDAYAVVEGKAKVQPATDAPAFTVEAAPGPTITIDNTGTYNTECQDYLCYIVAFDSPSKVVPTTFDLILENIENPESIVPAGDITIRTLLLYPVDATKYDGANRYFVIDQQTFPSNFRADKGGLDSMETTSNVPPAEQSFTYRQNQAYTVQFTPQHAVGRQGYIKVDIPSSFLMGSASSAVAQFKIQDASYTNVVNIYEYSDGKAQSVTTCEANCQEDLKQEAVDAKADRLKKQKELVEPTGSAATMKMNAFKEKMAVYQAAKLLYSSESPAELALPICLEACVRFGNMFLTGQVGTPLEKDKVYKAIIGGLRNPRAVSRNLEFTITTYDAGAFDTSAKYKDHIIDETKGGAININKVSPLRTFSAVGKNTTNGADTTYLLSWFTDIQTNNDDKIHIVLPPEVRIPHRIRIQGASTSSFACQGRTGIPINGLACGWQLAEDDAGAPLDPPRDELVLSLSEVDYPTGLYKVALESLINPPSLRGSTDFNPEGIFQTTKDGARIAEYGQEAEKVTIENEFAAELQDLGSENVWQESREYGEKTDYKITFLPYNRVEERPATIFLNYPSTISVADDWQEESAWGTNKCEVVCGASTTERKQCTKKKEATSRQFMIKDAIPKGWGGKRHNHDNDDVVDEECSIIITLKNPENNWGGIGLKLKTYEFAIVDVLAADGTSEQKEQKFLVDRLEVNALIPSLMCIFPCRLCSEKSKELDKEGHPKLVRDYCTGCWQDNPQKYKMTNEPFNKATYKGTSTCESQCQDGWTSNGDKDHICQRCDKSCATCEDNRKVGDLTKCKKCSTEFPFLFSSKKVCMTECGVGFYEVALRKNNDGAVVDDQKRCYECDEGCADCKGNQKNCTACDANHPENNSYLSIMQNDRGEARGSCVSVCTPGYFYDHSNPDSKKCGRCESPCSKCEGSAGECLECDGSANRWYQSKGKCYEVCPEKTAADMNNYSCVKCADNCLRCGTNEGANCFECERPYLLQDGECVKECSKPGFFANRAKTRCINKTEFPTLGPVCTLLAILLILMVIIVKKCLGKKETVMTSSIIAFLGIVETLAVCFQIFITNEYKQQIYCIFTLLAFASMVLLNVYNAYYIKYYVVDPNAIKETKLSVKKVKKLEEMYKKSMKRKAAYAAAMAKEALTNPQMEAAMNEMDGRAEEKAEALLEGGSWESTGSDGCEIGPGDSLSQRGSDSEDDDDQYYVDSTSSDEEYEGGAAPLVKPEDAKAGATTGKFSDDFLNAQHIHYKGKFLYQTKIIEDKGFNKWVDAYDSTAEVIKWISLFINFKFYRMTYSFFMGRKQFLVLFQKKKFKKHTVMLTLLSMFFSQCVVIVCDVVALTQLPWGDQLGWMMADSLCVSIFLLVVEFIEVVKIDKIMRTVNTSGHNARKSAAACESSESDGLSSDGESEDDDYPDWRLMLKNVEGNTQLFKRTKAQLTINELEQKMELKACESCHEFDTGYEKEYDHRRTRSFPNSPREYKNFKGVDFGNFGKTFDNVYAEGKDPMPKGTGKEYSEMGTQAQPSEILIALARKGGDLLTPGLEKDDYSRKKQLKKKRGRKNKYYKQIDAEDDEEADQMSEGSQDDGLDGIKEEDEEDDDEKMARLAKQQAERDRIEADRKAKEDQEKRLKEDEERRTREEAERAAAAAAAAAAEADRKEQERLDRARQAAQNDKLAEEQRLKDEAERKRLEEADKQAQLKAQKDKQAADKKKEAERLRLEEEEKKRLQAEKEAHEAKLKAEEEERLKKEQEDGASDLSLMMVKSNALQDFGGADGGLECPPNAQSRRFNECDVIGRLDRDEKGNVLSQQDQDGVYRDKDGRMTNERGYLIDEKTGNIINNLNGETMFEAKELDEKGEVPAPFNVEKHNFNPHEVRGEFDFDRNGKPIIQKNQKGEFVDKRGARVSSRGYRIDEQGYKSQADLSRRTARGQEGNIIDNNGRIKIAKAHTTQDGDLPKLFNYNGRRFDIVDCIGQIDKDSNGNILPQTDQNGQLVDNLGRRINSKGYLIDEFGNVIDKDGRQIFDRKHLKDDEIPKIFPFTKFNIKNVLGDFEMDPLGNPILDKDANGNFIDRNGKRVNRKGYLIDNDGNVINKFGKLMFEKDLLDNEGDIPKVFRTGLLKSDTASSLSRLMSEIGKNQLSDFDQEEGKINDQMAKMRRGNDGDTSVDSMMEDTPANYNAKNQRFDAEQDMGGEEEMGQEEMDDQEADDDEDEYGSQYDQVMGLTGFTHDQSAVAGQHDLAKKRKKKKKKKKKKPVEYEDPSLREHLLAGAYGGVAKKKVKRQGVKYTTDLNAGLRDIATPASAFMRDPSKKNMLTSFSGFAQHAGNESSGGQATGHGKKQRLQSSQGRSEMGSNAGSRGGGSRLGGLKKAGDESLRNLNPQQREADLKQAQIAEINARKQAKLAAKKRKLAGKPGKITKDADFEKMFGKDIDEFLEDSEWDIDSIDKMSQFSKNSKNTIRSANQAGKLRGLEKLYLQRIETSMNKNTLQMTGGPGAQPPKPKKKGAKFREFQDRYVDDPNYVQRGNESAEESIETPQKRPVPKNAWETGSRRSGANQSLGGKFKGKR